MMNERICADTIGSVYMAWSPILGIYDVRWAAGLPPFKDVWERKKPRYNAYLGQDVDARFYGR